MDSAATLAETESVARFQSPGGRALRRVVRKKLAMAAILFIVLFYATGVFAPLVAPQDPNKQHLTKEEVLQGPSSEHWLGTDRLGRDLASRVVYAARTTALFTFVVAISGSLFLGLGLGLLAGYRGGWVDTLIMRVGEFLTAVPTLFLMFAIMAAFRTRLDDLAYWFEENTFLGEQSRAFVSFMLVAAVTVPFSWIGGARIVRSMALQARETPYVMAAELYGASSWRVISRHLLPGVMPLFLVGVTAGMATIAGAEVALSFIGLGISPPTSSFGTLIQDGAGPKIFADYPHLLLAPAVPMILFFFAWNLLGDALVDILEPRLTAT
jgi:ABC-type dipeptide/oligopeptide/nickel transport system permease subunit